MRPCGCSLADAGRQALVGRDELVPSRRGVAGLVPGEVGGESLGMDLPPGPVEGNLVQGHTPDLDDQDGLAAVGGQGGLDSFVVRRYPLPARVGLVRLPAGHEQPPRGLARIHPPGGVYVSGLDMKAELAAGAEVACYLAIPAGQAARIGEG